DEDAEADAEPAVFSELDAEMVKGLVDDNEPENETDNEAAQSNVIKANPAKEEIPSEAQVRAEVEELKHRLVEEALADIAVMKNQAAEEVARDKAIALEAAKSEGYQEGRNTGYMELEEERRILEEDKRKHEEEYSELLFELEPKFVRYITNIYEKVFQVDLSEEKNIVVNLLRNAMQKVEGSKNYIVHVSKEDYKFVYERKKELADAAMAEDVIIDVVEDLTMKSGDALIETANGIFDCGVETQLTAIKKKLMLLAYNGE
ncbi:MAG: hypothetical protein II688_03225, partial [Lachnospiraceae bacterium]|nr:hypothetical protein [Lachnospiraceae bacterium]